MKGELIVRDGAPHVASRHHSRRRNAIPATQQRDTWTEQTAPGPVPLHDETPDVVARRAPLTLLFHPRLIPLCTNSTPSTRTAFVDALNDAPDHFTGYAFSTTHRHVSRPEMSISTMFTCRRSILPFTTSW